jgi:hypothetical protein
LTATCGLVCFFVGALGVAVAVSIGVMGPWMSWTRELLTVSAILTLGGLIVWAVGTIVAGQQELLAQHAGLVESRPAPAPLLRIAQRDGVVGLPTPDTVTALDRLALRIVHGDRHRD